MSIVDDLRLDGKVALVTGAGRGIGHGGVGNGEDVRRDGGAAEEQPEGDHERDRQVPSPRLESEEAGARRVGAEARQVLACL